MDLWIKSQRQPGAPSTSSSRQLAASSQLRDTVVVEDSERGGGSYYCVAVLLLWLLVAVAVEAVHRGMPKSRRGVGGCSGGKCAVPPPTDAVAVPGQKSSRPQKPHNSHKSRKPWDAIKARKTKKHIYIEIYPPLSRGVC